MQVTLKIFALVNPRERCSAFRDRVTLTTIGPLLFCLRFYQKTFTFQHCFLHTNRRRKLCVLHNFLRCIIEYCQMSQFSDSQGRRFESPHPRPHQKCTFLRCVRTCIFTFVLVFFRIGCVTAPSPAPAFPGLPAFSCQRRGRIVNHAVQIIISL